MPFTAWQPPAPEILELQAINRRIVQLNTELTREKNRRHASEFAGASADAIAHDIEVNIHHLERRIERMHDSGLKLVRGVPALATKLAHLVSTKGIAEASAMRLLAELLVLPDDLAAPQWVAHAGLDPRPYESGTSVHRPRRISKVGNRHLRAALYMPALVAIQHEPNVKAFYNKLVAAGKKPMQAVVAVMRKLLHAIWGMLKHDQDFDGEKFFKIAAKNRLTEKRVSNEPAKRPAALTATGVEDTYRPVHLSAGLGRRVRTTWHRHRVATAAVICIRTELIPLPTGKTRNATNDDVRPRRCFTKRSEFYDGNV